MNKGVVTSKTRNAANFNAVFLLKKISVYVVIFLTLFITLFPFYMILVTSFKTSSEARGTVFTWLPIVGSYQGYSKIFSANAFKVDIFRSLWNTLKIVVPSMALGLFISTMSAYAFAKRNFKFKNTLFWILLVSMMIPGVITMSPSFIMYSTLGLVDTVWPLMLPSFFGSATCVFFMRQFISGLPDSIIEAAKVDGLNHFQIFVKIILPLSAPALISQALLWFLGGYNDYMGPLMYLQTSEKATLQLALKLIAESSIAPGSENYPAIMAGALISLLPILILYCCLQKYFISGIAVSGMKA